MNLYDDINYWMSKCATLQQEVDVLNEKLTNASVIKWQTGEPKETGTYIVTTIEGTVAFSYYQQGFSTDEEYFKSCIIAWCKLSDIQPYKNKEEAK